jgi:N-acetylmuramoyl-L-alanine amidase
MKSTVRIRLLCLLLCLSVLAPCASVQAETTKVTGYLLRLREGASTDSKVIDAYPRGTKVKILKKGDTWTKVSVKDKEGYMMTCYLAYSKDKPEEEKNGDTGRKSSSATSSSSSSGSSSGSSSSASSKASKNEKSSSSGSTMYIEKGSCVNFREEANSDSAVIDSYRGGTKVTVLKKGKYWSRVEINGVVGYIATEFLTSEK